MKESVGIFANAEAATLEIDFTIVDPGPDFDDDGFVGLSDLNILGSNWGTTGGTLFGPGDADGDGNVGLSDLNLLGANWNPPPAIAVPEPMAVATAFVGLSLIACCRVSPRF